MPCSLGADPPLLEPPGDPPRAQAGRQTCLSPGPASCRPVVLGSSGLPALMPCPPCGGRDRPRLGETPCRKHVEKSLNKRLALGPGPPPACAPETFLDRLL